MKERIKLHNLCIDRVVIQSELKYLIGAKIVNLKCQVFGGKTGPFPTVKVFRVVRPVAKVQFQVEPDLEPTRQFGPVANTTGVPVLIIWRRRCLILPSKAGTILSRQMFSTYYPLPINGKILAEPIFYASSIVRKSHFSAPYHNRYII